MANIPSQIKRNARSLRERQENRQYTSQIKTYFRRLGAAVEAGDPGEPRRGGEDRGVERHPPPRRLMVGRRLGRSGPQSL